MKTKLALIVGVSFSSTGARSGGRCPRLPCARYFGSGCLFCGDFVRGRGMNIKGSNYRGSFKQMLRELLHRVELFARVALGILSRVPETEREDAIWFGLRDHHGLVDEPGLLPQNGQHFVINGAAEFTGFSGLAGDFDDSGIHGKRSFRWLRELKGTSRRVCAATACLSRYHDPTPLAQALSIAADGCSRPLIISWVALAVFMSMAG